MIRYLSLNWIEALSAAVAAHDGLRALAEDTTIGITQEVTGGPEGDVTYHLQVGDGNTSFGAGPATPENARFIQSWAIAVAIATGELNAQEAFISGDIRLVGDHQALIDAGPIFKELDNVFAAVREQTTYG